MRSFDADFVRSDWCNYQLFRLVVDEYLPRLRLVEKTEAPQSFVVSQESFSLDDIKTISEIVENDSFTVNRAGDTVVIDISPARRIVSCVVDERERVPADVFSADVCSEPDVQSVSGESRNLTIVSGRAGGTNEARYKTVAHFRSPQGALFYLGEILRAQHNPRSRGGAGTVCVGYGFGEAPSAYCPDGQAPLFLAQESTSGEVVVPYRSGGSYAIPGSAEAGRSMMALSLLTQLFGLSREASELPSTQTVNILN
jgi:hypothetical protein